MKLSRKQLEALHRVYCRNPDGSSSFLSFRRRVQYATYADTAMIRWCGMWLGIEYDGYTHS